MSELTDLEICKRIAQIDGVEFFHNKDHDTLWVKRGGVFSGNEYNPLTDDALNHQLMIKYKIGVNFTPRGVQASFGAGLFSMTRTFNESPNKAICLAIIEAHKDKS